MLSRKNMSLAKKNKNDEFYTKYEVIRNEMNYYKRHFKGKVVFCNCDDPKDSKFWEYFKFTFDELKLKKLIVTHYQPSLIFETAAAYKLEYDGKKEKKTQLKGDGDFRSKECRALMAESNIIVTNPPFSLFREYMEQLGKSKKKFLIIGNINSVFCKEVFPLLEKNKMWLGRTLKNTGSYFRVPDNYEFKNQRSYVKDGKKYIRVKDVRWLTNMKHDKMNRPLDVWKPYKEENYVKYDNYDAIEVGAVKDIPGDYDGIMGVPITFLDKYNPDQFEIMGCTQRGCHDRVPDTRKYADYQEMRPDRTPTGASGKKINECGVIVGNDGKHNYCTDGKRVVQCKYHRIFIRHKR